MLYCGIDIAKRQHAVALLDEEGQRTRPAFSIANDRAGFDTLLEALPPAEEVLVGLEATGPYWLALFDELTRQGYRVAVLNPLQVAALRRSGLRKVKNDRSDAAWVAEVLRFAHPAPAHQDLPVLLQLRELSRFRFHLSDQIGDIKRKVVNILDRVFPEYETLFSSVFIRASRELLAQGSSAQEIAEMDLGELEQLLHDASRGRFHREKAEEVRALAQRSVGVDLLVDAAGLEMQCLLAQIALLEEQRGTIDRAVAERMAEIPQHITSIPGIGPATGAAILAEIGDIGRFESADHLVGFAGIDPAVCESGEFQGTAMHMSKRGSPYLRHALWQAATVAVRYDEQLRAYYERKRQEGKSHGTALGAACRKLLVRVYVVLKENRPYERRPAQSSAAA